ncbi:MAG TPA: undecaprenyl-diphosphatase UppP [Bacillota bacterium]|nr:undecaprenyl-diphosphatase UppP [Bacillota bacterium]
MLDYIYALLIGIIQGLTEFLPVSSSGHLVLSQHLLGLKLPGLTFEILLHFGTLISVLWVFRRRLAGIFSSFWALLKRDEWARFKTSPNRWFGLLLILGSIPTAAIAFVFKEYVEQAFTSPKFVGIALFFTGLLLWVADILPSGHKDISKTGVWDALLVGVFQGLAVFPGVSRSGSTISGALWRGLDRKTAAEFSFLLSIPAILGATLLGVVEALKSGAWEDYWQIYLIGTVAAAAAGILAIKVFLKLLANNRLRYFSLYCWLVGVLVIILL